MPVEQDPFEYIVNVQWEEGLAVIFYPTDTSAPEIPTDGVLLLEEETRA